MEGIMVEFVFVSFVDCMCWVFILIIKINFLMDSFLEYQDFFLFLDDIMIEFFSIFNLVNRFVEKIRGIEVF